MFDVRSAARGAVKAAPTYLMSRIPTMMAGGATCYLTLVLLMGPASFFRTIWALAVLCIVAYGVHVGSLKAVGFGVSVVAAWIDQGSRSSAGPSGAGPGGSVRSQDKLDPSKLD